MTPHALAPDSPDQKQLAAAEAKIRALFDESLVVKTQTRDTLTGTIARMGYAMAGALRAGGKVLFCGNGGSAADAQHLAAELLIRLRPRVNREGIPALALAGDTSSLTACGNDFSFDAYYERLVLALGKPGDVLVGITTSGKSPNVLRAFQAARKRQMLTLGLLGCGGGPALEVCDLVLVVPGSATGRIQEAHITAGHAMLELVEDLLLETSSITPLEGTYR